MTVPELSLTPPKARFSFRLKMAEAPGYIHEDSGAFVCLSLFSPAASLADFQLNQKPWNRAEVFARDTTSMKTVENIRRAARCPFSHPDTWNHVCVHVNSKAVNQSVSQPRRQGRTYVSKRASEPANERATKPGSKEVIR